MSGEKGFQQINMDKKKSNDPFACSGQDQRLASEEHRELPESYGENRVVVMPVDPDTVHVYWECSTPHSSDFSDDQDRGALQAYVAPPERMLLRIEATATDAASLHHDFIVGPGTGSKYLPLPFSVKRCKAAIGKEAEENPFGSVISSDNIDLPPSPFYLRCKVENPSMPHAQKDIFHELGSLLKVPIDAIPLESQAASLAKGKQDGPGQHVTPDLTEQCENKFVSGISSRCA